MQHIFISFKHEDLDFAENVVARLEKEGFTAWADSKIGAGDDWRTTIDLAIKDAFALIVIMTPEAKTSEYVTYEWAYAWGMGTRVIPIMLRQTVLHPRLEALQYLDFTNARSRPWERLFQELRDASRAPLANSVTIPLNSPPYIRRAVVSLDSAVASDRESAIDTLVMAATPDAFDVLVAALRHPLPDVQAHAATGVAAFATPTALAALLGVLDQREDALVGSLEAVCGALPAVGGSAAVPALIEALGDSREGVRVAASAALGHIRDHAALPALIKLLQGSNYADVRSAAPALGEIGDFSATPALIEAARDSSSPLKREIARALGRIGDSESIPILLEITRDPDESTRMAAIKALGKIGDPATIGMILRGFDEENSDAGLEYVILYSIAAMAGLEAEEALLNMQPRLPPGAQMQLEQLLKMSKEKRIAWALEALDTRAPAKSV